MPEEGPRGLLDRMERLEAERRRRKEAGSDPKETGKGEAKGGKGKPADLDLDRIG